MKSIRICLNGIPVTGEKGQLLSELLRLHIRAELPCGGRGTCKKCRVRVTGLVSEPTDRELEALGDAIAQGYRLACMTRALGDCAVTADDADTVRVVTDGDALSAKEPTFGTVGAAVDLGTTTIAAKLLDTAGGVLAEGGMRNPQAAFGADVISRIEAAMKGQARELAKTVRAAISELLLLLTRSAGVAAPDTVVITGNTAMLYLFAEEDPTELSRAPFEAHRLFGEWHTAGELGLEGLSPDTAVYLPPCISSFVGADSVTALLAAEAGEQKEGRLLADVGTNGELLLRANGALLCCSTAAGPAFEGAGISCGMMGKEGAVDHVYAVNGRTEYTVIGGGSPVGICGSGLLDAVAALLSLEELDETGYLEDDYSIAPTVVLTQADVRAVQLAKGAVCAGIRTLLEKSGLAVSDVSELTVAGGFGSKLDPASAARVGLFPAELRERMQAIGNAALTGACLLLLDRGQLPKAEEIAREATTVELSSDPVFTGHFVNEMLFPSP